MLVSVISGAGSRDPSVLDELASLASSAGLTVVGRCVFRKDRRHAALFVGPGQADEIAEQFDSANAGLVIFDNALGPVQQRNLNARWSVPVLDRTELILEIFSARAHSREGKLQVELARLEHLSARLVRGWTHLERQRGGIGGRGGPGEKQVELDRRMLGVRVKKLRKDLELIRRQRANRRRARHRNQAVKISLVGYTNAGKSTLFNRLSGAKTMAADQLFATLDTLTRRVHLPGIGDVMLSDTVGFVRDLPHALIDAFKATLEETAEADLLLHVIDGSSDQRRDQIEQVQQVLLEIGADHIPVIEVFNKMDRLGGGVPMPAELAAEPREPASGGDISEPSLVPCDSISRIAVSAVTGSGIDELLSKLSAWVGALRSAEPTINENTENTENSTSTPSAKNVDVNAESTIGQNGINSSPADT
ncbi:MAG: GTPase HflX [Burkholderiaceae bacterium]